MIKWSNKEKSEGKKNKLKIITKKYRVEIRELPIMTLYHQI